MAPHNYFRRQGNLLGDPRGPGYQILSTEDDLLAPTWQPRNAAKVENHAKYALLVYAELGVGVDDSTVYILIDRINFTKTRVSTLRDMLFRRYKLKAWGPVITFVGKYEEGTDLSYRYSIPLALQAAEGQQG